MQLHALDRDAGRRRRGADYYLDKVANSVDDYYLGRGEAPASGSEQAAEQLGLPGRSTPRPPEPPGRDVGLGRGPGARLTAERRPGYDLTFSAPKGVSLLWAFGLR